ncbi:MAG: hypothetical protein HY817_04575 [Candidatus Abawacabacteria bacterium]|nr:hypothetical protein [Candidatus Abawacabacteria bacterium]
MSFRYWERLAQKNQLLRWGIFPGRYFYIADFFEAAYLYFPQYAQVAWPMSLTLFYEEKMLVVLDRDRLGEIGSKPFVKWLLDKDKRALLLQSCQQAYQQLSEQFQQGEFAKLTQLSAKELATFGGSFYQRIVQFWLPTIIVELANYGGWWLLQRSFSEKQSKTIPWLELIALEYTTFYQREELELLHTNDLNNHQQRYFWLQNNYFGTRILSEDFFAKRKSLLSPDLITQQQQYLQRAHNAKQRVIRGLALSGDTVAISESLSYGLWLQEERKQYILQLQHYKELFLNAVRQHYSLPNTLSMAEVIQVLQQNKVPNRNMSFAIQATTGKIRTLSVSETVRAWNMLLTTANNCTQVGLYAQVLLADTRGNLCGPVIIFNPTRDYSILSRAIVIIKGTDIEYLSRLANARAIIIEGSQSVTHDLLAVFARIYCHFTANKPALLMIDDITQHLVEGDWLQVNTNSGELRTCSTKELRGTVASHGGKDEVVGGVIVFDQAAAMIDPRLLKDKVVVVTALTMENVFLCRWATCILSESGGITSHGAIVCRELGIPCLVGMKNVTMLLSTGQVVAIDLKQGSIYFKETLRDCVS